LAQVHRYLSFIYKTKFTNQRHSTYQTPSLLFLKEAKRSFLENFSEKY